MPAAGFAVPYTASGAAAAPGQARWTIMVHMAAENNLEPNGIDNINQMEAGLTASDVNVLVLFDGNQQGDSKIYKIQHDPDGMNQTIISPVVDDQNAVIPPSHEIDSGDPAVLAKFVAWSVQNYPAQHYMLAIWDHGSGLFLNGTNGTRRCVPGGGYTSQGFAWDDNGGHMDIKDLNAILAPVHAATGRPIDVLGFDACLMAHVETGYQVKDLANYLVGSEKTEPAAGWDYQAWLAAISNNPTISPADVAAAEVDAYGAFYTRNSDVVTQSATDLRALDQQLVPAISAFAQALQAALPTGRAAILDARGHSESYENSDCVDLYHFAGLVLGEPGLPVVLKASAQAVMQALQATVIRNYHTPGDSSGVANAHGLVIYFPTPDTGYNATYDDPAQIAFSGTGAWRSFLKALIG
ncbi:MAG: hypothetical protein JOY51_09555 [Nevskia sp.]|nr:hypothetical protein [Nevskia sp.]